MLLLQVNVVFLFNVPNHYRTKSQQGDRKLTTVFEVIKYRCKICLDITFKNIFKPEKR